MENQAQVKVQMKDGKKTLSSENNTMLMLRRVFSCLPVLSLVFCLFSVQAFAADACSPTKSTLKNSAIAIVDNAALRTPSYGVADGWVLLYKDSGFQNLTHEVYCQDNKIQFSSSAGKSNFQKNPDCTATACTQVVETGNVTKVALKSDVGNTNEFLFRSFPFRPAVETGKVTKAALKNETGKANKFVSRSALSFSGFQVLYTFQGGADGYYPYGSVFQDASGNLWGTTAYGGNNYEGNVYQLTSPSGGSCPSGYNTGNGVCETVTWTFGSGTDGYYPFAGLVQDSSGNLWSTTAYGGSTGVGTVFELNSSGTETNVYSLPNQNILPNNPDGANPDAGLVMDPSGNFYGVTTAGGTNYAGAVFELSGGTFTPLYNLSGGGDNYGALARDSSGNLYGITQAGGTYSEGSVFELTPPSSPGGSWTETTLYSFSGGVATAFPYAAPVVDSAGNLYGTIPGDGYSVWGSVWEIPAGGTFETLHSFTGNSDGGDPQAGLTLDGAGNIYGVASDGGTAQGYNGYGVLFEISAGGTFSVLHAFNAYGHEGYPNVAAPYYAPDGNLYGTNIGDTTTGAGVVWGYPLAPYLNLTLSGTGTGTVTSNDGSINCTEASGSTTGTCAKPFSTGTVVTLTAAPSSAGSGTTFAGWNGGGCSGTGTCTVTMNANTNVTATFWYNSPVSNPITWNPAPPSSAIVGSSFTVGATAPAGTVTFANGGSSVCTYTDHGNGTATYYIISPSGQCPVTANQAGNTYYLPATVTVNVTATKDPNPVTFTTAPPASAAYNSSFPVAATAPGGTVKFAASGVCTDVDNGNGSATYTMTGASGTCSVIATQAGNADYVPGTLTDTVTAALAIQTITFTTLPPPVAGPNASFTVVATGGASGNPVVFTASGACSVAAGSSGNATYTMASSPGKCYVIATQAGNTDYAAATGGATVAPPPQASVFSFTGFQVFYAFQRTATDGGQPTAPVIQDASGNLWGTNGAGGSYYTAANNYDGGTVYEITPQSGSSCPSGAHQGTGACETVTYSFGGTFDGTADVFSPLAVFQQDSSGNFWGTTIGGGTGLGTVFELNSSGVEIANYSLPYNTAGIVPWAMAEDQLGNIYVGTASPGDNSKGALYEVPNGGTLTKVCDLPAGYALKALTIDGAGNLYGQAPPASGYNDSVFELSPPYSSGGICTPTTLYTFTAAALLTSAPLVLDAAGNLYGVTRPSYSPGTVWELSPGGSGGAWTLTTLNSFNTTDSFGSSPDGVIVDSQGNLYGTTEVGGNGGGTLFEIPAGGTIQLLHAFSTTDGGQHSPLYLAPDGSIYGTNLAGGNVGEGTVWGYNVSDVLSVTLAGPGTGSVTSNPAGINCPGVTCSALFNVGAVVTLTGPSGTNWTGCTPVTGTPTQCTVTISASTNVTATLTQLPQDTLTVAVTGTGSVSDNAGALHCPAVNCSASYNVGTTVTLTATPGANYVFSGWTGGGCSGTSTCTVTMNNAVNVTAAFTLNTYPLTVTVTGSGTISDSTGAINCPAAACSASFTYGTVVKLTATPATTPYQYTFTWPSNEPCSSYGSASTCSLTINGPVTIAATFTKGKLTKPTVTFTNTLPSSAAYGNTFTVNATSTDTSAIVTIAVTPSTVCSINGTASGSTVTMASGTGACKVTATSAADDDYSTATATATVKAAKVACTIDWGTLAPITYGQELSATQLDATASCADGTNNGALKYNPAIGKVLAAGTQALTVKFTPATGTTANYTTATGTRTLQVDVGSTTTTITGPTSVKANKPVKVDFSVTPQETGTGTAAKLTGAVTVSGAGLTCSGNVAAVTGKGGCTLSTGLATGSYTLSASYAGDSNNNASTSASFTLNVN